jgi:hypothetical protein
MRHHPNPGDAIFSRRVLNSQRGQHRGHSLQRRLTLSFSLSSGSHVIHIYMNVAGNSAISSSLFVNPWSLPIVVVVTWKIQSDSGKPKDIHRVISIGENDFHCPHHSLTGLIKRWTKACYSPSPSFHFSISHITLVFAGVPYRKYLVRSTPHKA